MISEQKFEVIKSKYGHYASWAVWQDEGATPKENVGDLSIFDASNYDMLLTNLNPNIILVGLNISRRLEDRPFGNFHDNSSKGQDYKLRKVITDTPLWGAYMTDVIKDFEEKISGKVTSYLNKNKQFEKDNVEVFVEEINELGGQNPTVVALGNDAYDILYRNISHKYKLLKIPHYSSYIKLEVYKCKVNEVSALL